MHLLSHHFLLELKFCFHECETGEPELCEQCVENKIYVVTVYILSISANCNLPFKCQKVDSIQRLDSWYQLCCGAIYTGGHLLQDPEED